MLSLEFRCFWHFLSTQYPFCAYILPITWTAIFRSENIVYHSAGGNAGQRDYQQNQKKYAIGSFHGGVNLINDLNLQILSLICKWGPQI
jgi:hypothetical protein